MESCLQPTEQIWCLLCLLPAEISGASAVRCFAALFTTYSDCALWSLFGAELVAAEKWQENQNNELK